MGTIWTNSPSASFSSLKGAGKRLKAAKRAKLSKLKIDLLQPVRQRLDQWEIRDPELAKFLYKAIPAQCPFERDIKLFGRKVGHIPPLCKLNPLYDQLVGLRFRALCYLVDECGVDIQSCA
ncbi:Mo-dependent nitrogenase C-terminal domain-containing protein [Microcoleus sp. FACHB-68]|uniref:Mo-dependent nitrogenase C-terminal domain-containing protein n=1 Tax=Microcoleus sp. FACHB-68 TaxID=2692826 RepID=UPI0016874BBF|nr:Mo-dependent nitrogenase C-terminal domain-containing protein [Microcoleus sp. FACHB-68]MBD1935964.1 Mo-dependent nitrogenase C-terminal domain-containing protein [Microcoleus sp. FACHB-68]